MRIHSRSLLLFRAAAATTFAGVSTLATQGLAFQSELLSDIQPLVLGNGSSGSSPEFVARLGAGFSFNATTFALSLIHISEPTRPY